MDNLPSIDTQLLLIGTNLHTTLIFLFLTGLHTGVYGFTIYAYFTKRDFHSWVIGGVLTALYTVILAQAGLEWSYMNATFIANNDTRLALLIGSNSNSSAASVITANVLGSAGLLLADGLLLWRCFYASGGSLLRISLPLTLYILEILMAVADITFEALLATKAGFDTPRHGIAFNILDGTQSVLAAVTSWTATWIIGKSIFSTIKRHHGNYSRHFRRVLDILVQTSVIYSLSLLGDAICDLINQKPQTSPILIVVTNYSFTFNLIITGFAPTLMVARVTLSGTNDTKTLPTNPSSSIMITEHPPLSDTPSKSNAQQASSTEYDAEIRQVERGTEV
ncbi:hypothetical protein CPC08DRAFT_794202 [Agrocybe pediades]|nr:hypothetical protein CPC08DRAFT_794202 [Agrocybe pediades]